MQLQQQEQPNTMDEVKIGKFIFTSPQTKEKRSRLKRPGQKRI